MNRPDQVFALFVGANPVVDPATAASRPHVGLLPTLEGSVDMQTQETPVREIEPQRTTRWRIPAVAAAVVAIVVGSFVLFVGDDPAGDVAGQAGAAPLDVVTLWHEQFEAGDVDGWQSLMSPDATFFVGEPEEGTRRPWEVVPFFGSPEFEDTALAGDSRMIYVASGSLNAECSADGPEVTCNVEDTNLFHEGDPLHHLESFTVEAGLITHYEITRTVGFVHRLVEFQPDLQADYRGWLLENHPEDHAELIAFGSTLLIDDPAQAERHRQFVTEWAASRG